MSRVLVVDDDPGVRSALRRAFALNGYDVVTAERGEEALSLAQSQVPDLVVLDVMLPGIDGLTVCEQMRATSAVPILMLTARDTVLDRVEGLDRGADDYLVKPFAPDELLARARALLRRAQTSTPNGSLHFSDVSIDLVTREAFRAGELLKLTRREYEMLLYFLQHPRQALSREQICQQVWGCSFEGESNFIDVAVKDLRRKLEENGRPRLLQTIRGFGYALREE